MKLFTSGPQEHASLQCGHVKGKDASGNDRVGNMCSELTRWLGEKAEALGVEIYPGFAASEVLYDRRGAVAGIATGDMGIGKDGRPKDTFASGMELRARATLFAEGCRGSLSEVLLQRSALP